MIERHLFLNQMVAKGTSESFMHHPANDRSWPKAEAQVAFFSVSIGEIT